MNYTQHIYNQAQLPDEVQSQFNAYRARLAEMQQHIKDKMESMPFLQLPHRNDDVEEIQRVAKLIQRGAKALVVFGTGGSSLGGQTLAALARADMPIHFLDNVDPYSMEQLFKTLPLQDTHFLMISKSGGTVETLSQSLVCVSALEEKLGAEALSKQCHVITMPGDRVLRRLAVQHEIPVLEHDSELGGRFTVLSLVGLIPAAVAGLDIQAVRRGAATVLDHVLAQEDAYPLVGAAWQCAIMRHTPQSVWMPYCDRLATYGAWVVQLWAESLGKEGFGSTPIRAVGAVDQHSQLQLYLDGPRDKSFNLITLPHQGHGPNIDTRGFDELDYLEGKSIGTVMAALQYGTIETLKRHGFPVRQFELDTLNEETVGALLMHMMLETVVAAELLGINAYDQPAVEEGKQIARNYLKDGSV